MFKMLVDLIFWIITKIASIIFTPITLLLTNLFPDLGDLIDGVKFFCSEYIFNTLQWTKMFLINVLAFPQELLYFLITVFEILTSIYVSMLVYKGVLTVYNKLKP